LAIRVKADVGSPWLPVVTMATWSGGMLRRSLTFMLISRGKLK
jgi:hypothetical protein